MWSLFIDIGQKESSICGWREHITMFFPSVANMLPMTLIFMRLWPPWHSANTIFWKPIHWIQPKIKKFPWLLWAPGQQYSMLSKDTGTVADKQTHQIYSPTYGIGHRYPNLLKMAGIWRKGHSLLICTSRFLNFAVRKIFEPKILARAETNRQNLGKVIFR